MGKIQKQHLERAAYIYVRQSSLSQVEQNLESQRRQYGLAERAKDLGWREVRVVDKDLGRSGSGHVERRGFETLLADVCQGRVTGSRSSGLLTARRLVLATWLSWAVIG